MAIHSTATWFLRVVRVESLDALDTHKTLERLECVSIPAVAHDVIAGRNEVAGIEAHADACGAVQMRDDRREVLETMAEGPSLSSRMLEKHHRGSSRATLEGLPDAITDEPQRVIF